MRRERKFLCFDFYDLLWNSIKLQNKLISLGSTHGFGWLSRNRRRQQVLIFFFLVKTRGQLLIRVNLGARAGREMKFFRHLSSAYDEPVQHSVRKLELKKFSSPTIRELNHFTRYRLHRRFYLYFVEVIVPICQRLYHVNWTAVIIINKWPYCVIILLKNAIFTARIGEINISCNVRSR